MCSITRWSIGIGIVVIALVGATPQARAQSSTGHLYDRWQLDLSGAVVIMGGTIRVDGSNGEGTDVGTDDLGLSREKIQPRASVRWRPGRRHELELGYQLARRSSEKTLERDIVFADSTYHVGADVKTSYHTDQAFLAYRYAIKAAERTQLGVGLGLGVLPFKFQLDALASAGGSGVTTSREKSFTGPTGSLGVYGRFLLGDRWYLESDLRGMAVKIDRLKAQIVEANAAGRYFLSDKFAIDLGYGISSVTLTVDPRASGEGFSGKIKYPLQHVRLGVVLTL